jgi:hypothetical protein
MTCSALLALCCSQLSLAVPKPIVRAVITSQRPIIAGQAVRLTVSVLAPNYFTSEPEFPQINVDNAIVVLPGETPQNSNEIIDGQTYAFSADDVPYDLAEIRQEPESR